MLTERTSSLTRISVGWDVPVELLSHSIHQRKRSPLYLSQFSDATKDKLHQLYRTSEKINFRSTVIDLVKLVQSCLYLYGLQSAELLDGLMCDVTERNIVQWWNLYGTILYDVEPTDGIFGPTTVAGILGMTLGLRYRLIYVRTDPPKDMMDVEHFRNAIGHFQEKKELEQTAIFDRPTVDKLRALTARAATGDHRLIGTKAIRNTVHDLSNRTQVNAADVETCDIEQFIQHLHGDRLRYMWQGKGRRPSTGSISGLTPSASFQDLKDLNVSAGKRMMRGVRSGANTVGRIVRKGPDAFVERVQNQRGGNKRERDPNDEVFLSPSEIGESLTPTTTRGSDVVSTKATPPKWSTFSVE
jgi:hypothetical protein